MNGYQKLKQLVKDQDETNEILREALLAINEKNDIDEIHRIASGALYKAMYRYFYEKK